MRPSKGIVNHTVKRPLFVGRFGVFEKSWKWGIKIYM